MIRGFVHNNVLTALSQYHDMLFLPSFAAHPEKLQSIVQRIQTVFANELAPKLQTFGSYVIDFAIGQDNDEVYVIELNPWATSTDSCLFSWTKDAQVLQNGPFEFRWRKMAMKGWKHVAIEPWKKFF